MGLITKPPSWGHCTTNISGTPSNTTMTNTAVTAGASNANGTAVSLLAAVDHDIEFLVISAYNFQLTASNGSTMLDILIDPAGGSSWASAPLISNLLAGCTINSSNGAMPMVYFFPIWVKSGTSIGCQARTAHTVGIAGKISIYAFGGNANPGSWWCGSSVEGIGTSAGTSQGTNHTAGNSGAFSAWTNLGSPLSKPCGALQYGIQGTNTDTTTTAAGYHFEFGVGSTRVGPTLYRSTNTTEAGAQAIAGPIFSALPAGTQFQVRGTCSGTAEAIDVAIYAVI